MRKPSAFGVVLVAGAVAAVGLRTWTLASPLGGLDSDEAVWGLMARHVLDGEIPVFFWGQNYGGTQEALLTAAVFAIGGSGPAAVRIVPIVLFAVATLLVWRLGRRTVGEPAARLAAVLFAVWPPYLVWKSTRAHGFYGSMLVLGLLTLLLAVRLAERRSRVDAVFFGLVLGLAWWATPQSAFVAVPALLWLVWRRRADLAWAWPALPALVVGVAPWLVWNVRHDWLSFETPFGPGGDTYVDHLRTFFFATLPMILGVRQPFSLEWPTGEAIGRLIELMALAVLVWLVARRGGNRSLLLVVAGLYPFLQALSRFSSLNEEPRYLVLLAPVLALALADLLSTGPKLAAAGLVILAVLTTVGLRTMMEETPPVPPVSRERVPAALRPALDVLRRTGQDRVRAGYAIAYRITFESGERIIAASTGQVRYPRYQALVRQESNPAWVFVRGSGAERRSARALVRSGYRRIGAGDWSVFVYGP